jgi:hypothetical protein
LKLESSPGILKFQKLLQKYVKSLKKEISSQTESKESTPETAFKWNPKLEMLVYAIIYSKDSLLKQLDQGSKYVNYSKLVILIYLYLELIKSLKVLNYQNTYLKW